MPPTLSHTRITAGDSEPRRWLLMLHGIYGSGRNWATVARRLLDLRPGWGVLLPDLRLHGESTGFEPPHNLEAAAGDVEALIRELGIEVHAILGHSYGGKVALTHARLHTGALRQVWVVDSTLQVREPSGSAWRLIEAVRSLPDHFATREELVEGLAEHRYPAPLANWLGMNLERDAEGLRWKLDWAGAEEMLRDYFRTDLWAVIENPPGSVHVHVIRALDSDSLSDEDSERIRAAGESSGAASLHELSGGHWINVDNPDDLVDLLARHLPDNTPTSA